MILVYLLLLLIAGIYSYSQIDLNLTLFQNSLFLNFQNLMIQVGYYNRQLSTGIFITLTFLFFVFYFFFIKEAEKLSKKSLIILVGGVCILGLISYPSFSHDIFNYIFDARIAVFHYANPYTSTALMFPQDTWIRFMNWTHRTYPYGPIFLPITFFFYFLGFNKFILTLFSFKAMAVLAYMGSSFLIYKIAKNRGLIFFALNPLIIYEAVIAGHLDSVMFFFAILGYYLILNKKTVLGSLGWIVSIGIKYATIIQIPAYFLKNNREIALVILGYLGALAQIGSRELLPHYFIIPLGFSALVTHNKYILYLGIGISLGLVLVRYVPFLLNGVWAPIGL